jgi:ABC-type polysaccharide/polyol phosphate export permease
MRIFGALLHRDMFVLKQRLYGLFIDGLIIALTELCMFGVLFPIFGMPAHFAPALCIGALASLCLLLSNWCAYTKLYERTHTHTFDYYLMLPVAKTVIFVEQIVAFTIEFIILTIPIILIAYRILPELFPLDAVHVPLFLVFYLLLPIFFSTFMLALSYHYTYDYFTVNLWPRRLEIIFSLSTMYVTWYSLKALSPVLATLFLLNPTTYFVEGLRASLIAGEFLSAYICLPVGILIIAACATILARGIKKRLDPV